MKSITIFTCPCGNEKNILRVELSYNDYNYFANKLKYDQRLMKSYEYYQSKYQIIFVYFEDCDDTYETLLESFINLNI
jgi:hypothetical protein